MPRSAALAIVLLCTIDGTGWRDEVLVRLAEVPDEHYAFDKAAELR